jgi:hypothetical protein
LLNIHFVLSYGGINLQIYVNRKTKNTVMIIIFIALLFSLTIIYKQINSFENNNQKSSVNNYKIISNIDYSIVLKPNEVYNDNSLGENNIYITSFVDKIKALFSYNFQGEELRDIKGNYFIEAIMEGYNGENENTKIIWKKQFELVPKENMPVNDKSLSINKNVYISLDDYNSIASKILTDSKVQCKVKLTVFMNIDLQVRSDNETIEKKLTPSITIPLNTPYFEIIKDNVGEDIKEAEVVSEAANKNTIIPIYIAIAVLLIALICVIIFIKPIDDNNSLKFKLDKIFKEHSDRIVALSKEQTSNYRNQYIIRSIGDLVKLADEVSKPIFYKYSDNYMDINKFYIVENNNIYIYDVLDDVNKGEESKFRNKEYKKLWRKNKLYTKI